MRRKYLAVMLFGLLLIGLIFSSGCVKKKEEKIAEESAFIGGKTGLKLSFVSGAPPDEVYECQEFPISLKIENVGETDIAENRVEVSLGGINPEDYGIENPTVTVEEELPGAHLVGKTKTPGAYTVVDFTAKAIEITGRMSQTLWATARYPYETKALAPACIRQNIYVQSTGSPEVCKINEAKPVQNSGAPIHITRVEEYGLGKKGDNIVIGFKILIENVGDGRPYIERLKEPYIPKELKEKPPKKEELPYERDYNRVTLLAKIGDQLSKTDVCNGSKTILLADGKAEVTCKFELAPTSDYVAPLKLTVDYNYESSISKKFYINDMGLETCESES